MAKNRQELLLLFDHPNDPIFVPRGDTISAFEIPTNYLLDRYRDMISEIHESVYSNAEVMIRVEDNGVPDLRVPSQLGRQENFISFLPKHRKYATALIKIFLGKFKLFPLIFLKFPQKNFSFYFRCLRLRSTIELCCLRSRSRQSPTL